MIHPTPLLSVYVNTHPLAHGDLILLADQLISNLLTRIGEWGSILSVYTAPGTILGTHEMDFMGSFTTGDSRFIDPLE